MRSNPRLGVEVLFVLYPTSRAGCGCLRCLCSVCGGWERRSDLLCRDLNARASTNCTLPVWCFSGAQ